MTGSISDPLYNGCNTGTDAVIVSVAYRLGAFGFLALESAGIRGNFAIQDILLALRWVQQNIHAFGGNKVSGQVINVYASFTNDTRTKSYFLGSRLVQHSAGSRARFLRLRV